MCRILNQNVVTSLLLVAVTFSWFAASGSEAQIFSSRIDAVPVDRVPSQVLRREVINRGPVDGSRLQRSNPYRYTMGPDDVIGVFVEGVLGEFGENPPIHFPDADSGLAPGTGFPIPVRSDGTISLPLIRPLTVTGLTIQQVEDLIKKTYTEGNAPIVNARSARILVSLLRKRTHRVTVIREDNPTGNMARSTALSQAFNRTGVTARSDRSAAGSTLQLAEGDNDIFNALIATGGLPGLNAEENIRVVRGQRPTNRNFPVPQSGLSSSGYSSSGLSEFPRSSGSRGTNQKVSASASASSSGINHGNRFGPSPFGQSFSGREQYGHRSDPYSNQSFSSYQRAGRAGGYFQARGESSPQLGNGDVVYVDAKPTEVYYTGGLLGGGEFPLPRDRRIDVLEAVALAGGTLTGANGNGSAIARFPPSELIVLRPTGSGQNGGQIAIRVDLNRALNDPRERIPVVPGDTLILRQKPAEAIGNLGIQTLNTFGLRQLLRN